MSEPAFGTHVSSPPLVADLPRVQRPPPVCPRRLYRRSRQPTVRSLPLACQARPNAIGYFGPTLANIAGASTRDSRAFTRMIRQVQLSADTNLDSDTVRNRRGVGGLYANRDRGERSTPELRVVWLEPGVARFANQQAGG